MVESLSLLATAALQAYLREQSLRQEIRVLRVRLDEADREREVKKIKESEFFQDLQTKAKEMRRQKTERQQKTQSD